MWDLATGISAWNVTEILAKIGPDIDIIRKRYHLVAYPPASLVIVL